MLGPSGQGAPTVALLGSMNYFPSLPNQRLDTNGNTMLVNCGPPSGAVSSPNPIEVFDGGLSRQGNDNNTALSGEGVVQGLPVGARRQARPRAARFRFEVLCQPANGTANGAAGLTRAIGNNVRFEVAWSINSRDGWGGLASSATASGGDRYRRTEAGSGRAPLARRHRGRGGRRGAQSAAPLHARALPRGDDHAARLDGRRQQARGGADQPARRAARHHQPRR